MKLVLSVVTGWRTEVNTETVGMEVPCDSECSYSRPALGSLGATFLVVLFLTHVEVEDNVARSCGRALPPSPNTLGNDTRRVPTLVGASAWICVSLRVELRSSYR